MQGCGIRVSRQAASDEASHHRQRVFLDCVCILYIWWEFSLEVCLRQSSPYPPFLHLQRLHPHLYLRTGCHHHHYIRVEQLSKLNEKNNFQVGSDRQMVFIFPISFNFFIISIFRSQISTQHPFYFSLSLLLTLLFIFLFTCNAMQCNTGVLDPRAWKRFMSEVEVEGG